METVDQYRRLNRAQILERAHWTGEVQGDRVGDLDGCRGGKAQAGVGGQSTTPAIQADDLPPSPVLPTYTEQDVYPSITGQGLHQASETYADLIRRIRGLYADERDGEEDEYVRSLRACIHQTNELSRRLSTQADTLSRLLRLLPPVEDVDMASNATVDQLLPSARNSNVLPQKPTQSSGPSTTLASHSPQTTYDAHPSPTFSPTRSALAPSHASLTETHPQIQRQTHARTRSIAQERLRAVVAADANAGPASPAPLIRTSKPLSSLIGSPIKHCQDWVGRASLLSPLRGTSVHRRRSLTHSPSLSSQSSRSHWCRQVSSHHSDSPAQTNSQIDGDPPDIGQGKGDG